MNEPTASLSASGGAGGATELLQRALADFRRRRQQGERVRVESYLEQHPTWRGDAEIILDLIYNEFMLREEEGEAPTADEYVRRFPELESKIRLQFEVEQAIQGDTTASSRAGQQARTWPIGPKDDAWRVPALPGYDIEQELGRGGMGVVYKARHRGLQRTVAVKMVLAGAYATFEELSRFQGEAEAVARLQHPNIVQIYEVGTYEGRPYFTLEFVDGGTLAHRLDGRPLPATPVAGLIEALARGVHHAHQRGIVHRDLKPGNVLLACPEGQAVGAIVGARTLVGLTPKITDFGLAKMVRGGRSDLTQTGDFLGTPSYCAPEQALGRVHDIGPLTDVYALGAMLYELLTGRVPFEGPTALATLDLVRREEPVPPSRLHGKLPRDLETICLKCLEKEPGKRYPSALHLAEDLRAYQEGRPIQARPSGPGERFVKWVRRRPTAAALLAVSAMLLAALTVGGWWTSAELKASAEREARQRALTEASFNQALNAVERMLDEVAAVDLADQPQMEPVRRRLLNDALGFYQKFLAERGSDPNVRHLTGRAFRRLGDIQEMLGEHAPAQQSYEQAIVILSVPGPEKTDDTARRREFATAINNRALLYRKLGKLADAENDLRSALEQRNQLPAERPEVQQDLAASHYDLGTVLARLPGKSKEAEQEYRENLRILDALTASQPYATERQRAKAKTLNNLGILLKAADRPEADRLFEQAIQLQRAVIAKEPTQPGYRRELARSYNNLAVSQWEAGRREAAEASYTRALDLLTRLTLDFPMVAAYRQDRAGVHGNLGQLLEERDRPADAEKHYHTAIDIREKLVRDYPEVPEYRQRLAGARLGFGITLERLRRWAEAESEYRAARALLVKLVADLPGPPAFASDLAVAQGNLAALLFSRPPAVNPVADYVSLLAGCAGNPWFVLELTAAARARQTEARDCLLEAVRLQESTVAAEPTTARYRKFLRDHCYALAKVELSLNNPRGAAAAADKLAVVYTDQPGDCVAAAEFTARCMPLTNNAAEKETYAAQAMRLLREAARRGYRNAAELRAVPAYAPLLERPDFQKLLDEIDQKKA